MLPEVESYIRGLASLGATFIRIQNSRKAPARRFSCYRQNFGPRGIAFALDLLKKGKRVGWVLGYGFWVLDADSKAEVRRVQTYLKQHGIVTPRVDTPSGGAHFIFAFPAGFPTDRLKAHVCHPLVNGKKLQVDFKLAFYTYCLTPGTVTEKGCYTPAGPWCDPHPLDPSVFAPGVSWEHKDAEWTSRCEWEDRAVPQEAADNRQWLPAPRDEMTRIIRAKNVLATYRPAIQGKSGRTVLTNICVHLRQYLGLSVNRSLALLKDGWNHRCLPPWSDAELKEALRSTDGKVPEAGVKEYLDTVTKRVTDGRVSQVVSAMKAFPGSARVRLDRLVRLLEMGGHRISGVDLGRRLSASGISTLRVGKSRSTVVPNLDFQVVGYSAVFKTVQVIQFDQLAGLR